MKDGTGQGRTGAAAQSERKARAMIRQEPLVAPACAWRIVPVRGIRGETLDLDGVCLSIPAFAGQRDKLKAVAAAACTLGPALEARITELFRSRQPSLALALDGIGTDRLFRLADQVCARIQREAKRTGLEMGNEINPGDAGLGLEAQRHVLALAGAGHSGISMTAQGMLSPVKSLSMLVALGQGLKVRRASTRCLSCPSRDRCAIRPQ